LLQNNITCYKIQFCNFINYILTFDSINIFRGGPLIKRCCIILYFSILLSEPFSEYKVDKQYYPSKVNDNVIIIDGLLNENEWNDYKLTKSVHDLVQAEPEYGANPSKKTEIKILYSNQSLYVAVYLFDDLDNIKTKNALYDDWYEGFDNSSDYFVIELDSDHDHQQSYCFAVNSSGVKADYIMYNDGYFDEYWNSVYWNAKVSLVDDGWIIEYEIPFKILDYFKNDAMGINFLRFSHSDKEYHRWVLLPMEIDGVVSHYGHINNL